MKKIELTPAQLRILWEAGQYYISVLEDHEEMGWKEGYKLRALRNAMAKL
jgi:hypothetical protein